MVLSIKQRGVPKGMIMCATVTVVAIVGMILMAPVVLSLEASIGERIAFTLGYLEYS